MGYHKSRSNAIKAVSRKMAQNAKTSKHQKQSFVVKEGKVLVTFENNLQTWMNMNGLNNERLSSRAGISLDRMKKLSTGRTIPTQDDIERLAKAFKVNVNTFVKGCDYTIPVNNKGINHIEIPLDVQNAIKNEPREITVPSKESPKAPEIQHSAEDEVLSIYTSLPNSFKNEIMSMFYLKLLVDLKINKMQFANIVGISHSTAVRYMGKKYSPSCLNLITHATKLQDNGYITREQFFSQLLKFINSYIPCYNLNVACAKYGFSLSKLSEIIGMSKSASENWYAYRCPPSVKNCKELVKIFHVSEEAFMNTIMTENDFPLSELQDANLKRSFQAERVREAKKRVTAGVKKEVVPAAKENMVKEAPPANIQGEAAPEPPVISMMPTTHDKSTIHEEVAPITDKIMKMYGKLKPDHKETVDMLIEKYFWEDIL